MGIIFDLDGTLVNTIYDLAASMNQVLEHHALPVHPIEAYYIFVGNGMQKLVERALPESFTGDREAILAEFLAVYAEHYLEQSVLYDGILDLLHACNAQGIPIAICTNKKQDFTDKIVDHYLPGIEFVAVVGDQFNDKRKPNPSVPLAIADMMGHAAEKVLFVGDSDVDMQTAKNAGMIPVGVAWGFRSVSELEAEGARRIVTTPQEILDFYRSLS